MCCTKHCSCFVKVVASLVPVLLTAVHAAAATYAQENKFKEAIRYYEPIVKKNSEELLGVTAIVLANLCVAYIMTSQNELAEELMRQVEREEEQAALQVGAGCAFACKLARNARR